MVVRGFWSGYGFKALACCVFSGFSVIFSRKPIKEFSSVQELQQAVTGTPVKEPLDLLRNLLLTVDLLVYIPK